MTLYVVTGAPCSGKTTHVETHAKHGDITVDFDRMAQCFGSPVTHDHSEPIRLVTMAARRAAIAQAFIEHGYGATVWVIQTTMSRHDRVTYEGYGAEFVQMTTSAEECHRRADEAGRPAEWHALIDEWFAANPYSYSEAWPV